LLQKEKKGDLRKSSWQGRRGKENAEQFYVEGEHLLTMGEEGKVRFNLRANLPDVWKKGGKGGYGEGSLYFFWEGRRKKNSKGRLIRGRKRIEAPPLPSAKGGAALLSREKRMGWELLCPEDRKKGGKKEIFRPITQKTTLTDNLGGREKIEGGEAKFMIFSVRKR